MVRQRELATLFDYMYWAHERLLTTATRPVSYTHLTLPTIYSV